MAKNLIQRMARGGQLQPSGVYSHQPIVLQESRDIYDTLSTVAETLFDPEQARADRELEYEKEMADKNYQLAQDSLALDRQKTTADISASRDSSALAQRTFEANLFFEATEDMSPVHSAPLAGKLGLKNVETTLNSTADAVMSARNEISQAKATGDSSKIREVINKHSSILDTKYGKSFKLDAEMAIEGIYAKRTLAGIQKIPGLAEIGIETSAWATMEPDRALRELERLPTTIKWATGLQANKIAILKEGASILQGLYKEASDVGTTSQIKAILGNYDTVLASMVGVAGVEGLKAMGDQEKKTLPSETKQEPEPEPVVTISADAEKVSESPLWKDENFMWISKDKKRKIFNARKAKQTLSKILNRNVTEKEAKKIYTQLETVYGKTVAQAKKILDKRHYYAYKGAEAIGRGALDIAAIGRGSPMSTAFEDVDIPISGAFASPLDAAEAQLQNQQDIDDILSGGI
jgi:hypothetical protein